MATSIKEENPKVMLERGLPHNYRYITDHDENGKAVFSQRLPELQPWALIDGTAHFSLNYTTSRYPVSFKDNKDIDEYKTYLDTNPGLVVPGGSVLRVVDIRPGGVSPMHRTVSIDYGVVLEGEIYLELDSGERRLMRSGDISIQRGTNHLWRNASQTDWGRMLYVLLESEPIEIKDKTLGEDLGTMQGVKSSLS
jgi:quercetin dioxygenase-like cupin family protein